MHVSGKEEHTIDPVLFQKVEQFIILYGEVHQTVSLCPRVEYLTTVDNDFECSRRIFQQLPLQPFHLFFAKHPFVWVRFEKLIIPQPVKISPPAVIEQNETDVMFSETGIDTFTVFSERW